MSKSGRGWECNWAQTQTMATSLAAYHYGKKGRVTIHIASCNNKLSSDKLFGVNAWGIDGPIGWI